MKDTMPERSTGPRARTAIGNAVRQLMSDERSKEKIRAQKDELKSARNEIASLRAELGGTTKPEKKGGAAASGTPFAPVALPGGGVTAGVSSDVTGLGGGAARGRLGGGVSGALGRGVTGRLGGGVGAELQGSPEAPPGSKVSADVGADINAQIARGVAAQFGGAVTGMGGAVPGGRVNAGLTGNIGQRTTVGLGGEFGGEAGATPQGRINAEIRRRIAAGLNAELTGGYGASGGQVGAGISGALSDVQAKTDLGSGNPARELAKVPAVSFRYTREARATAPEATASGKRFGVLAQDLEKAGPAGKAMVRSGPGGYKTIDVPQATGTLLAAVGQQQREIEALKALTPEYERLLQRKGKR